MPRRKISGRCKIRKRASSSSTSSSSSSLPKNCRLKRAILVAKRAGSSTPVPSWKMGSRSPCFSHGEESRVSARRLAASLWEIDGLRSGGDKESFDGDGDGDTKKNGKLLGAHQSQSPVSKNKDGSVPPRHHRRKSSAISDKFQLLEMDSLADGDSVQVATRETSSSINSRLKDVSGSLVASKEIVKVLFRLWGRDEQTTSRMTLVSALRVEIDRARQQVEYLIHEQRHSQKDMEIVLKERVLDATSALAREVEIERKLRRQSERLNKRLGRELADTRKRLSEAESERRAREVLARDDREEVEREREMLQLADVLREERVQMKLAEASYEYEEKNAALERLRSELEVYLGGKERNEDEDEDEDSGESELDSIELNMDSANKSYKWSFVNEEEQQQAEDESRRASVEEVFKGRRSLSEKIQWENICLMKKSSDNNNNNNNRKQGGANGFEKARLSEVESQDERSAKQGFKDAQGNSSMRFSVSLGDHLSKGIGKT